jgi:hypothetical protein
VIVFPSIRPKGRKGTGGDIGKREHLNQKDQYLIEDGTTTLYDLFTLMNPSVFLWREEMMEKRGDRGKKQLWLCE